MIFITAFPERLLTGERPEPTFLVTKPFNPDMVKALISQALFFNETTKVGRLSHDSFISQRNNESTEGVPAKLGRLLEFCSNLLRN